MLRLTNEDFEKDYGDLSDYARLCIDKKYPCGDGGWIHYRVLTNDDLGDIERLLSRKLKKR
ncbi:MAG: DUF3788 domain-containing protein [Bacilli bacterium]|jgi:hypothetical protein|nr:DUF3788 domain-containing protein [Bacilli bacterium]